MLSYKVKVKGVVGRKLKTKNTYAVLTPEGQSNCNSRKKKLVGQVSTMGTFIK